jgi:crotonobetainyl-CoA:carnitine CoA-transferase CaiB-like acyl-CoA transferase
MVRPRAPDAETVYPRGAVLRCDEALNDERVTAREMIMETDHPLMGRAPDSESPNQKDSL